MWLFRFSFVRYHLPSILQSKLVFAGEGDAIIRHTRTMWHHLASAYLLSAIRRDVSSMVRVFCPVGTLVAERHHNCSLLQNDWAGQCLTAHVADENRSKHSDS